MHTPRTLTYTKIILSIFTPKKDTKNITTKICIPWDTFQRGRRLIEIIIDHAHQTIGHYGQWKTSNYIPQSYWWPQMATNIEAFCRSCGKYQTNKTDMQKPQGLLHSLPIPDKPWQLVGMDFMGLLPQSQGNDYLLVIID